MTGRDRIVLIAIATFLVLGAGWFLGVAPQRKEASKLDAQLATANAQLSTAEGELASARAAQARYIAAYSSIVNLGKAVPPTQEVPSLIFQLDHASNQKGVNFNSITTSGGPGAPGGGGAGAKGAAAAELAGSSTGFTQMPFTFVFNGTFVDLYRLFQQLDSFTERTAAGDLRISGRLLTIQSVKLAPATLATGTSGHSAGAELSGTITATAYVLPASQGLTAGATPSGPAGLAATPAGAIPSTPAIARVTP